MTQAMGKIFKTETHEEFFPDGTLSFRFLYKNGKKHGLCVHYRDNGQSIWNGEYKSGKERGLWYERWYDK